jgi:TM2 domain-containing membrane protein YozV
MPQETERLQDEAMVEAPAGELPPGAEDSVADETVYCPQCGARMTVSERYCGGCGWDAQRPDEVPPKRREPPPTPRRTGPPSDYSRMTTFLLCLLLGFLGVHRFYVGRVGSGVLWLFTGGVLAVGWIYDLVMIGTGEFVDEQGKRVVYWQ